MYFHNDYYLFFSFCPETYLIHLRTKISIEIRNVLFNMSKLKLKFN